METYHGYTQIGNGLTAEHFDGYMKVECYGEAELAWLKEHFKSAQRIEVQANHNGGDDAGDMHYTLRIYSEF